MTLTYHVIKYTQCTFPPVTYKRKQLLNIQTKVGSVFLTYLHTISRFTCIMHFNFKRFSLLLLCRQNCSTWLFISSIYHYKRYDPVVTLPNTNCIVCVLLSAIRVYLGVCKINCMSDIGWNLWPNGTLMDLPLKDPTWLCCSHAILRKLDRHPPDAVFVFFAPKRIPVNPNQ